MKITKFEFAFYRNISEPAVIDFSNYTVLIGKNNQGKTNVLRALGLAFDVIRSCGLFGEKKASAYNVSNDYPRSLWKKRRTKSPYFILTFSLSSDERTLFQASTDCVAGDTLSVAIVFPLGFDSIYDGPKMVGPVRVLPHGTYGKRSAKYNKNIEKICRFIYRNFQFAYVPAIRSEGDAKKVISDLIMDSLRSSLDKNDKYDALDEEMFALEKEAANAANERLIKGLHNYLDISNIHIDINRSSVSRPLRNFDISLDDGIDTPLAQKGSGVASLIVIALIQSTAIRNSLIAMEEPESHLHADAIHRVYEHIAKASEEKQIIVSTHNPSFVPASDLKKVYIVEEGKLSQPESLYSVRESLGLKVNDMLFAENNIIVEGMDDKQILEKVIPEFSSTIADALAKSQIQIIAANGASNIFGFYQFAKHFVSEVFTIFDSDKSGRDSYQSLIQECPKSHAFLLPEIHHKKATEIEDFLPAEIVEKAAKANSITSFSRSAFLATDLRFNDYAKKAMGKSGIEASRAELDKLKINIVEQIEKTESIRPLLDSEQISFWENLAKRIETCFHLGDAGTDERYETIDIFSDE